RLRAAVFVEVAVDPIAEWDDAADLAGLGHFLRIQRLASAAKPGKIGTDPAVLVDCLDRAVEEPVGGARRFRDFLAPHGGQLIDLFAELGAVRIEFSELVDELRNAVVELARLLGLERDESRRFGSWHGLERVGRLELELRLSLG